MVAEFVDEHIGCDALARRPRAERAEDPLKRWKLSDMDLASYARWDDYTAARDAMFQATDTAWAPWYVANNEDKKRGRLNLISHLLSVIPYEPLPDRDIEHPKRKVG